MSKIGLCLTYSGQNIDNILGMFDLQQRLVNAPSAWLEREPTPIDSAAVNAIWEQRRSDSMAYLDHA